MRTDWLKYLDLESKQKRLVERNRELYEKFVFYPLLAGLIIATAGTLVGIVNYRGTAPVGFWGFALGIVLVTMSMGLSMPLETFRVLSSQITGGSRYDTRRFWKRLKTTGVTLHILTLLGAFFLLLAFMSRVDLVSFGEVSYLLLLRLLLVYALALFLTVGYGLYLTLRTPLERRSFFGFENLFFYLGVAGSVVFGFAAATLATGVIPIEGTLGLRPTDAPVVLLTASTLAGFALYMGRSPPTLKILLTDEREYYAGLGGTGGRRSVLLPAIMAFTLLFIVVLSIFVFGVGVVGLFEEIPANTVLFGVIGFIILGMAGIVVVTVVMSRSEDTGTLYKTRRSTEDRKEIAVQAGSAAFASIFFLIAGYLYTGRTLLGFPSQRWLDFFSFGLLAALGPYGFYVAARRKRVKDLEARFPDFLRDLAASNRAGLTLTNSVTIASHGEYGALTPEIVKMADQLSWNVPFTEALDRFAERVQTPLVERAVSLIMEADSAGGNVTDVLVAAAKDAREIKNLENERRTTMVMYTAIIYITFAVFLGGAAVLYGTFIPQLVATGTAVKAAGISGFGPISFNILTLAEYRTFYYLSALVQAVGNGFVAGLIESGSALAGMRHSFIMVAITWITFTVVLL